MCRGNPTGGSNPPLSASFIDRESRSPSGPGPEAGSCASQVARPAWGAGLTLVFSAVAATVFVGVESVVTLGFALWHLAGAPHSDQAAVSTVLQSNGLLVATATILAGPPTLGCLALLAWSRKGPSLQEYFAFRSVAASTLLAWLSLTALLAAGSDGLTYLLGRPLVPEWVASVYRTATFPPVLWFALLVMAPLTEEVLFRGFLMEGLRSSALGSPGALLVTSAAWAATHVQYDAYEVSLVLVSGLLLGAARLRTRSIYAPLAMHALYNLIATLEVALTT